MGSIIIGGLFVGASFAMITDFIGCRLLKEKCIFSGVGYIAFAIFVITLMIY